MRWAFLGLLLAFSFFSWRSARRLFVDARNLAYDVVPTYVAWTAGTEGGPDTRAVFWATGFGSAHPPVLLFKLNTPTKNYYGPFEYLPITQDATYDHLLFFADAYAQILPYVQWIYPGLAVKTLPDRQGRALAYYVRVDKSLIARSEGLDGSARIGGKTVAVEGMAPSWPSPGFENARDINVSGSLAVDDFGDYHVSVTGQGDAQARVDGKLLFSRVDGSIRVVNASLAKGLHDLTLRLKPGASQDQMHLRIEGLKAGAMNVPWVLRTGGASDVPKSHVLRMRASGFGGEYFESRFPQGQAVVEAVEPIVLNHWLDAPLLGNWCVRWRTRFLVSAPGSYRFSANGGNFTQVKVDSKIVWRQGQGPDGGLGRQTTVLPSIQLSKGWHHYEALFSTGGPPDCDLGWTTPDGKSGIFWVPDMQPVF